MRPKPAFHEISEFSTSRLGAAFGGQLLKHSFSPKVVNQRSFPGGEMSANHCEILPHRGVADKLSNQCVSIRFRFCKEQNPGGKTIDAMHDKGSLSLPFSSAESRDHAD